MIGIVIVSHSPKVAEGVSEMADQMTQQRVRVIPAGGVDDNTIGTNAERIYDAIRRAESGDGVLVLLDLGSAVMSAQIAVEMLDEAAQSGVQLSEAPLVEGAILAAVEASLGHDLDTDRTAAEAACTMQKLR